jgi:ethanolamine utilization microcompartment shell protein EutL
VETNELEQRVSTLQEQIEQLRRTTDRRPLEERLVTLTEFGTAILKRWAVTADRHAAAVSQFEAHLRALGDAGSQLQDDAAQRLQDLERVIEQEWDSLRQIHEVPVKQLVEQAANLTEVCIATANAAQHGFDRAEARLAALESEFQRSTSELTREIQNAVAELRSATQTRARQLAGETQTPAWPLEDVTRLHTQLRDAQGVQVTEPRALTVAPSPPADANPPVAPSPPAAPVEPPNTAPSPTGTPFSRFTTVDSGKSRRVALIAGAAVVLLIAAGAFAWRLESQVRASAERLNETQQQLRLTTETAARQINETQVQASRAISEAQELTARAQMLSDVLAAPDLIRFPLVGRNSLESATGQVLWSRSRGILVFSASGLPAPTQDSTYQVWLLTRTGAISVATFDPDADGRATVTAMPKVPPLVGAMVTMERRGGNDTPSGEPLLTRAPLVSSGE